MLSPRASGQHSPDALLRLVSAVPASDLSDLQRERRQYSPPLPWELAKQLPLRASVVAATPEVARKISNLVDPVAQDKLRELFPSTYAVDLVELVANHDQTLYGKPLRIGVVLSGGQAAGGHNVISGLFDYITSSCNPDSQLFGFLDGPKGIFTGKYKSVTPELLNEYRNMGGFDLLGSGRDKIESPEQLEASLATCMQLELDGLVVIGGDDSNTNAAILAEYFKARNCPTSVIGVPKTIDGDLKNSVVETSFGYDSACKTYCEEIGNVCVDAISSKDVYAFIRLMGRSASHITLECALTTRVNLALIGEEIHRDGMTLKQIVDEIVELVLARRAAGKTYGVFLFPEGLIEFIPEVGTLIKELNEHQSSDLLSAASRGVWEILPEIIREQLLLDRDPHGNVQVAKIATEQLLILMVEDELQRRLVCSEEELENWFRATSMYFGYEGRACMPSDFDAQYCYALGHAAGGLVSSGLTGYMATISNLAAPVSQWTAGGCPLVLMMTLERRKGKDKPVIKKYLVDLDGAQFKAFRSCRDAWKLLDCYCQVGPLQFDKDSRNYMISPPCVDELLPSVTAGSSPNLWREQHMEWMSDLQKERLRFVPEFNPDLLVPGMRCGRSVELPPQEQQLGKAIRAAYPNLVHSTGNDVKYLSQIGPSTVESKPLRVGVVFLGLQAPGCENIVWGLQWRLGSVVGFFGARGLVEGKFVDLTERDISLFKNQGGITMLGKDGGWGSSSGYDVLTSEENMDRILRVCEHEAKLDGLVLVGGPHTLTDCSLISEYFLAKKSRCKIVAVPATVNNNIRHPLIECSLGFHSASHAYASLVGNLLTDCASAKKYWYFVRLLSNDPSTSVLEAAMQTNPHVTVVSEECARQGKDIFDVVKEIAETVQRRQAEGKNWGVVLIPEGLISHLPSTKQLMKELGNSDVLSSWAKALLQALPPDFEKQLFGAKSKSTGRFCLTHIKTEEMIAEMVRGVAGSKLNAVTFFFGLLGRGAMPSNFDCSLGLSLGMLAGVCVESGLTGVCTVAQRLCLSPREWQLGALPLTSLMTLLGGEKSFPVIPSTSVDISSKAYRSVRARGGQKEDVFGNPGPMQLNRYEDRPKVLLSEQGNVVKLNQQLLEYLKKIKNFACNGGLGLSEAQLRTSVIHLRALCDILASSLDETAADLIQAYHENVMQIPTREA